MLGRMPSRMRKPYLEAWSREYTPQTSNESRGGIPLMRATRSSSALNRATCVQSLLLMIGLSHTGMTVAEPCLTLHVCVECDQRGGRCLRPLSFSDALAEIHEDAAVAWDRDGEVVPMWCASIAAGLWVGRDNPPLYRFGCLTFYNADKTKVRQVGFDGERWRTLVERI